MKRKIDYSLYLVTDRILMSKSTLEEAVEQAMIGGCTLIQLREKEVSSLEFYHTAMKVKRITEQYNVPLVINDRVDIALAIEADGIHIGQSDLPASAVRRIIGKNKLLGVSVSSVEEAHKAMMDGADYLGVGAMFSTGTKIDAKLVSMEELKKIKNEIKLPIVAIGGINQNTVPEFKGVGIDGIAVVSAIIAEQNIVAAAQKMRTLFFDL